METEAVLMTNAPAALLKVTVSGVVLAIEFV